MSRNPRPCTCGRGESDHPRWGCLWYRPAPRVEPLRAPSDRTLRRMRAVRATLPGVPMPGETVRYEPAPPVHLHIYADGPVFTEREFKDRIVQFLYRAKHAPPPAT